MTNEQIIIAVAKLAEETIFYDEIKELYYKITTTGRTVVPKPTYDSSRDAIVPVIEKQTSEIQQQVWINICALFFPVANWNDTFEMGLLWSVMRLATARQLSIALLKASGKWEE